MVLSKCLNCDGILNNVDKHLFRVSSHEILSEIFKITIDENILRLGEICNPCNFILHTLHDARKDFILRSKCKSLIGCEILRSNIQSSIKKEPESKQVGENVTEENILPFDNSMFDNEENEAVIKTNYIEKQLVIKIPKLVVNSQQNLLKLLLLNNCDACGRNFTSAKSLNEHFNAVHSVVEKNWCCKPCNVKFSIEWFYRNHLKTFHGEIEIKFSCFLCDEKFRSQEEVDDHKLKVHRITSHPFKCNHCDVAFETLKEISNLREHLIQNHSDSPEAKAALYNSTHSEKRKPKSTIMKCFICNEDNLKGDSMLSLHMLFVHFGHQKCSTCEMEFSGIEEFRQHVLESRHEQTHCPKCQKLFGRPQSLVKHFESVHNPSRSYPFVCEMCGTPFCSKRQLKTHYKWHVSVAGPREFNCSRCPKIFAMKHHLKLHMIRHQENDIKMKSDNGNDKTKNSPKSTKSKNTVSKETLKCDECGCTFNTFRSLSHHRRVHVDKGLINRCRERVCPTCGKIFTDGFKFRKHLQLHENGKK